MATTATRIMNGVDVSTFCITAKPPLRDVKNREGFKVRRPPGRWSPSGPPDAQNA